MESAQSDIYVVGADGGSLRQFTTGPAADIMPFWSKDGRWIFFGSDRGGDWQIWKIPAGGGQALQVTKGGGYGTVGTTDGFIYCHLYRPFADYKTCFLRNSSSASRAAKRPASLMLEALPTPRR